MTAPRNRRLSVARGFLHDFHCLSEGCRGEGDNDHARRTQHALARVVVDEADPGQLAEVLHAGLCRAHRRGGCPSPAAHIARHRALADSLARRLAES